MILHAEYRHRLQRHPLFEALSPAAQDEVLCGVREQIYTAGTQIIHQGQEATHFFLVLSGRVKLYRISADGQEKVVEIIPPGQTFAEAVMFLRHHVYPVCAEGLEDVRVATVPNAPMLQALAESPSTCLHLLGHLSVRLHQRLAELETLTLQNATQRFALYLIQQLENRASEHAELDLMLPKRLIAARLSMQPETLSRIIGKLREEGLIEVCGRHVRIPSVENLLGRFNEPAPSMAAQRSAAVQARAV